jgi:hypothetical protein
MKLLRAPSTSPATMVPVVVIGGLVFQVIVFSAQLAVTRRSQVLVAVGAL